MNDTNTALERVLESICAFESNTINTTVLGINRNYASRDKREHYIGHSSAASSRDPFVYREW